MIEQPIVISKARYAQNSVAVKCPSVGMFKSRAARVVEAIGGRWSNREKSYILASTKEERLRKLIAEGYDGIVRFTEKRNGAYQMKMVLVSPENP